MEQLLSRQNQLYKDAMGNPVGDCLRTAVACLLLLPRDEVPHFAQEYPKELDWWYALIDFVNESLADENLSIACYEPNFPVYLSGGYEEVIAVVASPRGDWNHCILVDAATGKPLWDPWGPFTPDQYTDIKEIFVLVPRKEMA